MKRAVTRRRALRHAAFQRQLIVYDFPRQFPSTGANVSVREKAHDPLRCPHETASPANLNRVASRKAFQGPDAEICGYFVGRR
jgi:hypothetical protein